MERKFSSDSNCFLKDNDERNTTKKKQVNTETTKKKKKGRKINCPYCKKSLSSKNRFCTNCGNQLNRGINDKTSNLGIIIEKTERLKFEDKYYNHLKPKIFLPHHLTEPIYLISHFPVGLKPEDYYGGFNVINLITEKTAFFLGATPDKMINQSLMRQPLSNLQLAHYHDCGRQFYDLMKNTNSLITVRVNKNPKTKKKKKIYSPKKTKKKKKGIHLLQRQKRKTERNNL